MTDPLSGVKMNPIEDSVRQQLAAPIPKAKVLSKKTILLANTMNAGREETVEEIDSSLAVEAGLAPGAARGTITHTTQQKFVVFKKYPPYGWRRLEMPANMAQNALANGCEAECGACGDSDCGGYLFCTAREPLARRRCPVCNRQIPDEIIANARPAGQELEPGEIEDDRLKSATPAERTLARLKMHMTTYHPQQAAAYEGMNVPNLRDNPMMPQVQWPNSVPDNPATKVGV